MMLNLVCWYTCKPLGWVLYITISQIEKTLLISHINSTLCRLLHGVVVPSLYNEEKGWC